AHYVIAIIGFWLLSRVRGLSQTAAVIGALTFALGGFLVSTLSTTNNLQTCAWAPWAVAQWMRRVEGPAARRHVFDAQLALVLALQILGGAPEVLFLTLFLMGAWTVYQVAAQPRRLSKLTLALLGTVLLAVSLTAFQIAPTIEYVSQSARRGALPYGVVSSWSLEPVSLLQLVLPPTAAAEGTSVPFHDWTSLETTEPWIRSIYLGVAALCLIAAAVASGRERGFWSAMIVLFMVLALGAHTPVFRAAYELFSWGLGKFRFPAKFFFVVHFSAALLAAEGAEACFRADRRALRTAVAASATLIALAAFVSYLRWRHPALYLQSIAALSGRSEPMTTFVPLATSAAVNAQRAMSLLAVFSAILVLRRMEIIAPATSAGLLSALVAADVATAHHHLHSSFSWSRLRARPPLVDVEELRRTHQRIFPYQTFSDALPGEAPKPIAGFEHWAFVRDYRDPNATGPELLWRIQLLDLPMVTRVGTLGGVDGISRSSDNTLRSVLNVVPRERGLQLLRTFGTAFLIGPAALDLPDLEPLASTRAMPIYGYRVRDPAPAVYLASRLILAPSDVEAFNRMISPGFRPGADVTVGELPGGWNDGEEVRAAGDVRVADWSEERIRLRVRTDDRAFLVVNDSYFPGWEARVDDAPSRIFRANVLVRGVVVPAGDHVVALSYRPRSFRVGVIVSMLSGGALVAAFTRRYLLSGRSTV
ncbi:MAG: YfhO family protein, partial [Candidatus Binatia bacterium]